nr:hypothetical protein [Tanacetum cinerariifolium]
MKAKPSKKAGEDNDVNVDENADETDNEDDADQNDDVDEVLANIETLPFLNTPKRSKKKENGKDFEKERKQVKKAKKRRGSKAEKPYPTCHPRSSLKALYETMMSLSDPRKKCLKEMGFERMIHFPIVELPSSLAFYVIEHFHPEEQFRHLQKPTPPAIALVISDTEEVDFMFKMNFVALFESTMGTENGGRASKNNWKDVKIQKNFYYGPLGFLCYKQMFNDAEFNLYESSNDEDSEGDADEYIDKNNNNDDDDGAPTADANKQNESDNQKEEQNKEDIDKGIKEDSSEGIEESGSEGTEESGTDKTEEDRSGGKDDGKEVQNNENEEKITRDNIEVAVQMDVDNQNEEKIETEKEKQGKADKVENVQEKQDADTVEKVQEIKDQHNDLTEDEFWNTQTDSQIDKLMSQAKKDIKNRKTPKRKSTVDMTPPTFSLGLSLEEPELKSNKVKSNKVEHAAKRAKNPL